MERNYLKSSRNLIIEFHLSEIEIITAIVLIFFIDSLFSHSAHRFEFLFGAGYCPGSGFMKSNNVSIFWWEDRKQANAQLTNYFR